MERGALARHLDELLEVRRFSDYCPNGMQVEGKPSVARIVGGVTASLALIHAAIDLRADAILVHHGWFWRGEDPRVIGTRRERLRTLLAHDIGLFAYHLPLDAHPLFGNNAALARALGWTPQARFGEHDIGMIGVPYELPVAAGSELANSAGCTRAAHPSQAASAAVTAGAVAEHVAHVLRRQPLLIGEAGRPVTRVAWCTGAAQSWLQAAIDAQADLYVSGEISEPTVHLARESGVAYLAAGHHATERYGVQALGAHLADRFGLEFRFVEIDNPA